MQTSVAVASTLTSIGRPSPNFIALERRFVRTCSIRMPIPSADDLLRHADRHRASRALEIGGQRCHQPVHHLPQVQLFDLENQPVARQAGHVEQIVDQGREAPCLGLGNGDFVPRREGIEPALLDRLPEKLDVEEHGREGSSQLVRGDGQEVVARPDGVERLGQEPAVLQADGGPAGEIARQDDIVFVVAMRVRRGREHHDRIDSLDSAPRLDRNAQERLHADLSENVQMLGITGPHDGPRGGRGRELLGA